MNQFTELATDETLAKTAQALEANGIKTIIVATAEEARTMVSSLIPNGAEVMTMTSITLDETGISTDISESGTYTALHPKVVQMDRTTQAEEIKKLRSVQDYALGSVHAITEDGHVLIASRSGSQLPAYVYGANHVLWVAGSQKIVKNVEEGMKRINEYVLPLESERAHKAYGVPGSYVNKLLIFNREDGDRLTLILVKEQLGY